METKELIKFLESCGVTVTVTELSRWVREGVLNTPSEMVGRGRARGIVRVWPKSSIPVIIVIHKSLKQHRSFNFVRYMLKELGML